MGSRPGPIRVVIADDHAIVRQGLRRILSGAPDIAVVGEASNSAELLQQLMRGSCDVVILDITMPARSGLDLLPELMQEKRRFRVLVLSIHPEDQLAARVLRAGASGYMNKACPPDDLVQAIRKVSAGGKVISPSFAEQLAEGLARGADCPPHERLSNREYEVLCLLASGEKVSGVARQLLLSAKTVSTYRRRILEKMGMRTNAQLTCYALKHRLVDDGRLGLPPES